jgi:DNA polymerase-3 subunit gamma/tau
MSLAVKYRPKTFEDVLGQKLNKKILKAQLKENDISTGYLFSGGSGVGKTTIARIFANELNAETIEIDGASNNSVDNIRQIRENTKMKSMISNNKLYIIDEAHQLSKSSFNALLKTLEEPPEGVVFILATTEPEKIIPTIHTRVQHFEFTRISWTAIAGMLEMILEKEGQQIEKEVVEYIAKIADGSVRSAVSILERALKIENPTIEEITELTGSVNYPLIFKLFKSILTSTNPKEVLEIVEKAHQDGKNLTKLIEQTAKFTVELTKYALFREFDYIKVPIMYEENLDEMVEVVTDSGYRLRDLFNEFNNLYVSLRYENDEKLLIQGHLMKMMGD